jgi:hypothetical protein
MPHPNILRIEEGKMSNAKHTPGPWIITTERKAKAAPVGDHVHDIFSACERMVGRLNQSGAKNWPEAQANARLIAAAPELLDELKKANRIIRNALQIMTSEQSTQWGQDNARDGVDSEGITRRYERDAAIAKAEGAESAENIPPQIDPEKPYYYCVSRGK